MSGTRRWAGGVQRWITLRSGEYVPLQVRRHEARRSFHTVLARDGWTCGLCGGPIPRAVRGLHPLAASLDHIIPVADGGSHSAENLQPAHLNCNHRRGRRFALTEEQQFQGYVHSRLYQRVTDRYPDVAA